MRDGGKGDARRPLTIPKEEFEANWDAIFNKPEPIPFAGMVDIEEEPNDER